MSNKVKMSLNNLKLDIFSERGFDAVLEEDRLNTIADEAKDFEKYWWNEIVLFEKSIDKVFGPDSVFVSDSVPSGKRFAIEARGAVKIASVFEFVLSYLRDNHPDASVVVASLLHAPMPAARLVIGLKGCFLEQDILAWYVNRAPVEGIGIGDLQNLRKQLLNIDISTVYPWLIDKGGSSVSSFDFWSMIYSGRGFNSIWRIPGEEWHGYEAGYRIIDQLYECAVKLGVECEQFYLSSSLPKWRVIKIECSCDALSEQRLEEIVRTAENVDSTWALRFSVFEELTLANSYLGGIVVLPGGKVILETPRSHSP